MAASKSVLRRCRRFPWRRLARLDLELLETRTLPATSPSGLLIADVEPNDTLDVAQNLGAVSIAEHVGITGTIGGALGGADVDWFQFTLDEAALVSVAGTAANSAAPPLVSLYNSDPFDFNDPFDPLGHRLLEQGSTVNRALAGGTYYVAISGNGNHAFNPFVAASGYPGATGPYRTELSVTELGFGTATTPTVLALEPAAGAVLTRSPQILRVDFNTALDPSVLDPTSNITLTYNPIGDFGGPDDQIVPLAFATFSEAVEELQILPAAALPPGYYRLTLSGDSDANPWALIGTDGVYLGTDTNHPDGQDFNATFQITGSEGNGSAAGDQGDDTAATAHELGNVLASRTEVSGAIGDDPSNPVFLDSNDVDLYHFRLDGPGRYAFEAEVFGYRVGSPLAPGVSLFRLNPTNGQLEFVDGNDGTQNRTPATAGPIPQPLFSDSALFAGITAGDYYVAVSSTGNVPVAALPDRLPGENGIFDPNVSHSGWGGLTFGDYQLNVQVTPDDVAPRVVNTSIASGALLDAPPDVITVQFSEPVNLPQLAYDADLESPGNWLDGVYIAEVDGTICWPRFRSFDPATNTATFVMYNALPNGAAELHLSGALGLTDLAGNPLVGNSPSGDYIVPFAVQGPARGTDGNPLLWTSAAGNDSAVTPQSLGTLFPTELAAGVVLVRDAAAAALQPGDTADYFTFQILQSRRHGVTLTSGPDVQATLTDAAGNTVVVHAGQTAFPFLAQGSYLVRVDGWTPAIAAQTVYQVTLSIDTSWELPTTLTVGPAPALRIKLATLPPPSPSSSPSTPGSNRSTLTPPVATSATPPPVAASPAGPVTTRDSGAVVRATSGLFAELAASPIGAIRGPDTSSSDRVLVQGPNPSLLDALVQLSVLTSPDALTATTSSAAPFVQSLLQDVSQTLDQAIEELFRVGDWLRRGLPMPRDVVLDEELVLPNEAIDPPTTEPPILDETDSLDASEAGPNGAAFLGLAMMACLQTVPRAATTDKERSVAAH